MQPLEAWRRVRQERRMRRMARVGGRGRCWEFMILFVNIIRRILLELLLSNFSIFLCWGKKFELGGLFST